MRAMIVGTAMLGLLLLGPSAEAQDADPLAELAALGDAVAETGPEGGGSIRAKKDADLTRTKRLKDKRNVEGRVEAISSARFPLVAVTVKVRRPAADGAGKTAVKKNDTIVVVPKLAFDGKQPKMTDDGTRINAGAFYLQKGDKVMIRLGAKSKNVWEAEYIERK